MCAFHRLIVGAREGRNTKPFWFHGDELERWGLKVLLGTIASGILAVNGDLERMPDNALHVLFGRAPMPSGCGFLYVNYEIDGFDAHLLSLGVNRCPARHRASPSIFGVTISVPGFQFIVSLAPNFTTGKQTLTFRPDGFLLGAPERGRIGLGWNDKHGSARVLVLKMPPTPGLGAVVLPKVSRRSKGGADK
jgi:hypothetical protein